jgi:hypothetical protein
VAHDAVLGYARMYNNKTSRPEVDIEALGYPIGRARGNIILPVRQLVFFPFNHLECAINML